jgi:HK97 family phage portal protein
MAFWDFLRREKSVDNVVQQDQISTAHELYGAMHGLAGGYWNEVDPMQAYRLYTKSSVLGMTIHRIARAVAGLQIGLTSDEQDFVGENEVTNFLHNSVGGYTKMRLLYELTTSYLLTNEAWLILRGNVSRPPIERTWVYPFDLSIAFSEADGYPVSIRTYADRDTRVYMRQQIRGRMRYIDERGLNELIPIIGKETVAGGFRGMSPLGQLLYDIQQGVEGKRHNSAVLANGVRSTAAVMPQAGETYDQKARDDVGAAIKAQTGAGRAGGVLVFPRPLQTIDVGTSNQEMDYIKLLADSKETVYNFYGIPLPLMMNNASTFNNYKTAQTSFYDQAVFPVFDAMFDVLEEALIPRYSILERADIAYNENTIRALTGRNIERMKEMRATQALTTDEIRATAGYGPVDNGDDVMIGSNLVPLGQPAIEARPLPPIDDEEAAEEETEEEPEEELAE